MDDFTKWELLAMMCLVRARALELRLNHTDLAKQAHQNYEALAAKLEKIREERFPDGK